MLYISRDRVQTDVLEDLEWFVREVKVAWENFKKGEKFVKKMNQLKNCLETTSRIKLKIREARTNTAILNDWEEVLKPKFLAVFPM